MKKIELIIIFLLFSTGFATASSSDDGAKMIATTVLAGVVFGIIALVRNSRNKNKDN